MIKKFRLVLISFLILFVISYSSANNYLNDVYFTVPDTIYKTNETIELKGFVYQANYTNNNTLVSSSALLPNAIVNLSIRNSTGSYVNNYTFTTDANGTFYSKSNYYASSAEINASSIPGVYYIRAQYNNPSNNVSYSEVEIKVVNQTLDVLSVSSEKASYNPSESVNVNVRAIKKIGDKVIYVPNVSVSGSLRNSSKNSIQNFSCTTEGNGKCTTTVTAPSSYGSYILELENFKTFNSFSVIPFSYNLYMKDELGKSYKNVFAVGEQAKVEIKINNASNSDTYSFSGYIADSAGNSVKSITSTTLNSNNSFTNSFLFTVDALTFSPSSYSAHLTIAKTGDGSISSITSFKVQDWALAVNKKSSNSGFEYEYSTFANKTLRFEALPTYRVNGSVINNISSGSFSISLKDSLSNAITTTTASWNASCGKSGCYEFLLTSPLNSGKYNLYTTLVYNGDSQINNKVINVISGVMSAQSTDKDGSLKELFGTNEYAYLSLSAYNSSISNFSLSDAEIFIVSYMNGTEFSYSQTNYSLVNSSNSIYEWAWNSSLQRIKIDVPKFGGVYDVFIFGNNRSLGTTSKFVVNPYDVCSVPKDTQGTVSSGSGYYYVWQFKTSDTIYFEIKMTQANNPLGKAPALNGSGNSSTYGMGSACVIDTSTKQVVSNATITLIEVKNLESGALQNINTSGSNCQASDTSGGYTCTVKPFSKWDGGQNIVKFNVQGQDGTTSTFYSMFEAKAFYLYGWSSTWQNNPSSNIALSLRLYEAGGSYWSSYGASGGISGTVSIKRVEYQGRDGEWIWPPVNSGYNSTNLSSVSITSGTGSITLPASLAPGGTWKTGNYRVVLQATTSSGDSDVGYAWFAVKLWDVYGQPIECLSTGCSYKSYFNSKENITLYVTITKAGSSWWSSNTGGQNIYGNVTVGIKKIQDCRTWPCKELNSSQYSANTINVNASSSGYWYSGTNLSSSSKYLIQINSTTGTWGTGYYSVVLDVNGTDTGYAWFNTIAFYVDTQPVNASNYYTYTIRGSQAMFFNVTTTKNYRGWGVTYNASDYLNTTVNSISLRTWDQQTYQQKEFSYPTSINISSTSINGNALINITYLNGSWPAGYYWGELSLKNSENETSTGWLWFSVQPFRVSVSSNNYNIDSDQCVNSSLNIYNSDWSSSSLLYGNYSVISVSENIWGGYSSSTTAYSNFSVNSGINTTSFNATANVSFCPNNGVWSGGSWGGYHYLNIIVKDNVQNDTQTGWLSFRTIPFSVSWSGTGGNKQTNQNFELPVNITKPSSGASTTGNLTKLYQWRYDNYQSTKDEYVFSLKNSSGTVYCWSNVSTQCRVNGTANVTIYPPSAGWKVGYNYIQSEWTKDTDSSVTVQDWSGIYFEGREAYNGYFTNSDLNGYYKYYFAQNENITIMLTMRDNSYNQSAAGGLTISGVQYALAQNCWSESCLSYSSATFSPTTINGSGVAILKLQYPSANWTRGEYAIKATVQGVSVTGGRVRVRDSTAPNITLSSPVNNGTYNSTLSFSATTTKNSQCSVSIVNYGNFYNWYCGSWNSTNSTNLSAQTLNACNTTKYSYSGNTYYNVWVSNSYHSIYDGSSSSYCYTSTSGGGDYCYGSNSSGLNNYMTTGGTSHSITYNTSSYPAQDYGMSIWCYDDDYNYINTFAAFKVNNTI